ncbi:hypothetical protein FRC07_008575 [Ceratobasidium sp. 392]|nr:hypothetical protein FRC07_008575 [Ceratobasidium sp. 392]
MAEKPLRSALANSSSEPMDINTLERIEHSRDVNFFLGAATPNMLYGLLKGHAKRSPAGRVLGDRYGQICLRILIRLVQLLVCENNGTLEYVGSKMEDVATNAEVSTFLAEHTAALAMGRTTATLSFLTPSGLIGKSRSEELFSDKNTREMLEILWQDRKSVLVLYKNGSLQGLLLLLYAVWIKIGGVLVGQVDPALMIRLRDLLLRVYLVTTFTEERNHIRSLCVKSYEMYNGHQNNSIPFDMEDSRAVVHAYYQCVTSPIDPDPQSSRALDMFRYLIEFVSDLTDARMYEEPPLVARAAIERLWQAYDTEKIELLLRPTDRRSQVMYYMGDLQYALG